MDDELLEIEEEQQQPEPSKNRFLDAAHEARFNINAPTPSQAGDNNGTAKSYDQPGWTGSQGRPEAPSKGATPLEEVKEGLAKERGLKTGDFTSAFDKKGTSNQAEALGKAALDLPKKSAQATAGNVKRMGTFAKNKRWFALGGAGLATLIPIALFFFWLMLFKNVHIKNLYVTYRWAQFNRGINQSLKQELAKAKEEGKVPKGDADTVIPDDATSSEIIEKSNAADLGPDKLDPENQAEIDKAAKETSSAQQSIEGSSQEVADKLKIERSVKAAGNAEEAAKNVADEIADAGKSDSLNPDGKLKEGAEEAKKLEESGKSAKTAASEAADSIIKGGGNGFSEAVQKATGPFVIATFYCIFRDIYVEAKQQINQIIVGGASTVAQEVNKTADCQKVGECSLDQAGAVANKFDNDKESASDTCGWKLAEGSDTAGCEKINPRYTVQKLADRVGGTAGDALVIADQTLDVKSANIKIPGTNQTLVSVGPKEFCPIIMNSWVQGGVAVANLAAIVASGGSWGAAGEAVAGGVATAAATAGGKALIAHAILTYSGGLFKDLGPHDMGNLTDMGNLAMASGTCKAAGCVKVTPQKAAALNNEYRQELIAKNKKRSVVAKLFDTKSSDSVLVRAALRTPSTPKAAIGRMSTFLASITNPIRLNRALGATTLAFNRNTALAADADTDNPYGIAQYVPANIAYNISAQEADSYYDSLTPETKATMEQKYKQCNNMDQEAFIEDMGSTIVPDGCSDTDYVKYAAAKFNQVTLSALARAHNNQTKVSNNSDSAVSGDSGGATPAGNPKRDIDTSDPNKYPCPAGTSRSVGNARAGAGESAAAFKVGLCDIGGMTVNASAAQAFLDMKNAAAKDGVTLFGGGYRSYDDQVRLRIQHGCGGANLFNRACKGRPPTAVPGRSMHEVGLAVDFKNASYRGGPVYNWLAANAKRFGIYNLPSESWHWSTTGN